MTSIATPDLGRGRVTLGADARDVGRRLLVGTAAGALAGALIGGVGGRLVMLVLRLTSDPLVVGVTSDDGFEIGRFTFRDTLGLVAGLAAAGAVNGAVYAVLRGSIPRRLRTLLWTSFAAAFTASQVIHADGVDFTLLEPAWLAVVSFVVLPGLAALCVVLLVERWLRDPARAPRSPLLAALAVLGTIAAAVAAALWVVLLVARRLGAQRALGRLGRVVVPLGLGAGTALAAWRVVDEAAKILG